MIATLESELAPPHPVQRTRPVVVSPHFDLRREDGIWEEVRGTAVEKKMGAKETGIGGRLDKELGWFVEEQSLGETFAHMEFRLDEVDTKRRPDVAYVSYKAWPKGKPIPDEAWWNVTPELTVEVISPYELTHATLAKVQEYFLAGVQKVWVVFPHIEQVYCYAAPNSVRIHTRDDTLTEEGLFPGFGLPLATLFPRAEVTSS